MNEYAICFLCGVVYTLYALAGFWCANQPSNEEEDKHMFS